MTNRLRAATRPNNTNRVIKGAHDQESWISYRFAHANMRLRDRYDVEITREKYESLSVNFSTCARGIRRNSRGDFEGWVEVQKGIWACAAWKPDHRLIGTFLPCPPPLPKSGGAAPEDVSELQAKLDAKKAAYVMALAHVNRLQQQLNLKGDGTRWLRTLGWLKTRIQDVRWMVEAKQYDGAQYVLDALASLPQKFDPTADESATAKLVEERAIAEAERRGVRRPQNMFHHDGLDSLNRRSP